MNNEKPLEEKEFPDPADMDGNGDEDHVPLSQCRSCGELVYDDAPMCPHCREWIVRSDQTWRQSRKWYLRAGLYLAKTLVLNWIVWSVLGGIAAILALWRMLR